MSMGLRGLPLTNTFLAMDGLKYVAKFSMISASLGTRDQSTISISTTDPVSPGFSFHHEGGGVLSSNPPWAAGSVSSSSSFSRFSEKQAPRLNSLETVCTTIVLQYRSKNNLPLPCWPINCGFPSLSEAKILKNERIFSLEKPAPLSINRNVLVFLLI